MSGHKKQHFVPKCYLRAWCDPSTPAGRTPYVWIFDKDGSHPRKKAPINLFFENDMYTVLDDNGNRHLGLEHALGQLENDFVSIRRGKLERHLTLEPNERMALCFFVAAMHARTKVNREHVRHTWAQSLEQMRKLRQRAETATEELRTAASISTASGSTKRGFTYEDVKRMVEKPLQTTLPVQVSVAGPLLYELDFAIVTTNDAIGFITSDNPCVWWDNNAYKRSPFYRSPALMYDTIEITMPVSPKQCILLNRQGLKGYLPTDQPDIINRRTRFFADEQFVVRKKLKREIWFDPGIEPNGSWEKMHLQ